MRYVDRLILSRTVDSVRVRCPAKVNLFLRVTGKRSDGYHEVQNVMQTVTLFDQLKVRKEEAGVTLTCSQEEIAGNPEDNLAYRAADLFTKKGYVTAGVHLELTKRIPVAAGLGGGSSDAACCLLALNELFEAGLSGDELRSLAAELGSDVPFFIEGGTAICTGRGDVVRKLRDAPPFAGILTGPGLRLMTSEMYDSLSTEDFAAPEVDAMLRSIEEGDLKGICSGLFNSFETLAFAMVRELPTLRKHLQELGSMGTVLCGSGPTLLGIFPGRQEAETALARIRSPAVQEAAFTALVNAF